jgi:hypothetical protein
VAVHLPIEVASCGFVNDGFSDQVVRILQRPQAARGHISTEMPAHSTAFVIDLMMPRFFGLAFMVSIPLAAYHATKVDSHLRVIFFRT